MKLYLFLLPLSNFCCMSLLGMVKYISIIGFFNIHSKQVNKAFNEVNNGVLMNIAHTLQHTLPIYPFILTNTCTELKIVCSTIGLGLSILYVLLFL